MALSGKATISNTMIKTTDKQPTFADVEAEFLSHHPNADRNYLREAFEFADWAHHDQKRRSGEPYITHPTAVAFHLASWKLDVETVAAGFLHDTVEDNEAVELNHLEQKFGFDLAQIVDGVTKIGKVRFRDKVEAKAENYRKMILAMAKDVRVLIVKLADRYHNMTTLEHLRDDKRKRISQETLEIFSPLAHRIGMTFLKTALETISFRYMEPEAYKKLNQQLLNRQKKSQDFMAAVRHRIKALVEQNDMTADVSSRLKSIFSIHRKMQRKNATLDGLYDYYAFRIITESVEDCYAIFGLLHSRWQHMPGRIKDFIASPKSNLYQSLHTTLISDRGIPFEVQIRTRMMHRIAEEGVAAHWTYKNGRLLQVGKSDFENWIRRVAEDQGAVEDKDEYLDTIKGQLSARDILVFTPDSEIKTLPKGATPLDFAYMIHTEVGHRAHGAKVDGKMVPLRSELQSGSIVEILTRNESRPSEEWLHFVKTPSARAKIRAWLRVEARTKAEALGRDMFERELKRHKIPLKTITNAKIIEKLPEFGEKKLDDFYAAIGFGRLTASKAVRPFGGVDAAQEEKRALTRENRLKRAIQRVSRKSKQMVQVRGQNDILVNLANCCKPIVGDAIVGYITRGHGISVHRQDCKSFLNQKVPVERIVSVAWENAADTQLFNVQMRLFTEDRTGMVADLTKAIADTKTNIMSLKARSDKGKGVFDMMVQIHSLDHLKKVTQNISRVKGVLDVQRTN